MNGNRGAKGSIKDRLISILYKTRYKKKKLKSNRKSTYNKSNNEKNQINRIDTSSKVKINLKRVLIIDRKINLGSENIKTSIPGITIKQNNIKKSPYRRPIKRKGIVEKESNNVKSNSNEEIINVKEEVDKFIKKSIENIDSAKRVVNELKKKDAYIREEKYNELKSAIDKLKKQYDDVKDRYDLSEFSIAGSIKLISSIDNYESKASLNEIDTMLSVCKSDINKIESITIINQNKKKTSLNTKDDKTNKDDIKIKFNKSKEKVEKLENIKDSVEIEIKRQKQLVDDMYEKSLYMEKEITKKIEVIGHRKIISSFLRIIGGIITLPFTGSNLFGIALGSTMINKGLKELNKKLETREKIVINYKYEDISRQINNVKDKLEYINLVLSDSLNEIKKLKENFKKVYSGNSDILKEYESTLKKIDELENKLKNQQLKLLNVNKKLTKEKENNKQKLKKIGKN